MCFLTAAKDATAKTYVPIVIGVNVVYVVLLVLGFSSSSSSQYDGFWPYEGTKFGLLGMLVTWLQQGYAYVGIIDHAAKSTAPRSTDLVGGIYLDLLMATIVTQFLSLFHTQEWFYITIVGVPLVGLYKLYHTFYGSTSAENTKKKNTTHAAPADDDNEVDPTQQAKRERRAAKRRQKWT